MYHDGVGEGHQHAFDRLLTEDYNAIIMFLARSGRHDRPRIPVGPRRDRGPEHDVEPFFTEQRQSGNREQPDSFYGC